MMGSVIQYLRWGRLLNIYDGVRYSISTMGSVIKYLRWGPLLNMYDGVRYQEPSSSYTMEC